MPETENRNAVEMHGCIVCARTFNVLAIYTGHGKLVSFAVTSSGGHPVTGGRQPLVACDTHTKGEIETAILRWQSRNDETSDKEIE